MSVQVFRSQITLKATDAGCNAVLEIMGAVLPTARFKVHRQTPVFQTSDNTVCQDRVRNLGQEEMMFIIRFDHLYPLNSINNGG